MWLDFGEVSAQEALKLIHPTENITFHRVSSVVNSSRNNTPECLLPLRLLGRKVGPLTATVLPELSACRQCDLFISCCDLAQSETEYRPHQIHLPRARQGGPGQ